LADVTDNESDPVADGHPGDGFSLYEEYRGFIIGGQHVEVDPKKKAPRESSGRENRETVR